MQVSDPGQPMGLSRLTVIRGLLRDAPLPKLPQPISAEDAFQIL